MSARTVVVTGISSFVGVHVGRAFAQAGWRVIATNGRDHASYEDARRERLAAVRDLVEFRQLDIMDPAAVKALADRVAPDLWVQQAGFAENCGSVAYDTNKGFAINVASRRGLFDALAGGSCGVILTGSDAEYGGSETAHVEDGPTRPDMPYGVCKLAETIFARQQSAWTKVPVRVARLYIPIGVMDNPSRLLMAASRALAAGKPVDLSPCTQRRDFIGIGDVARGYLALAEDMKRGGFDVFNLSSGEATELSLVLKKLARAMNADESLLKFGAFPLRPGEPVIAYGSNAKAKAGLGWAPRSLDRAIVEDVVEPMSRVV